MLENSKLNYFKAYREFEISFRIQKALLTSLELELAKKIASGGPREVKAVVYDKIRSSKKSVDIVQYYNDLHELNNRVILQRGIVSKLEEEKESLDREIEEWSKKYNDIELKVFFLHHIKGLKLYQVARITNYSYDWIKKINSKINKSLHEKLRRH